MMTDLPISGTRLPKGELPILHKDLEYRTDFFPHEKIAELVIQIYQERWNILGVISTPVGIHVTLFKFTHADVHEEFGPEHTKHIEQGAGDDYPLTGI